MQKRTGSTSSHAHSSWAQKGLYAEGDRVYIKSCTFLLSPGVLAYKVMRQLGCSCRGVGVLVSKVGLPHAFPSAEWVLQVLAYKPREQGRMTAPGPLELSGYHSKEMYQQICNYQHTSLSIRVWQDVNSWLKKNQISSKDYVNNRRNSSHHPH